MKAKIKTHELNRSALVKVTAMAAMIMLMILSACQKDEDQYSGSGVDLKSSSVSSEISVYYGPVKFLRNTGTPVTEERLIEGNDFWCYESFVLKIRNGNDKSSRVSSAMVWIDGKVVAGPSDFSKNVTMITKTLTGLTPESVLTVCLKSAPGSFLEIWIEGKINLVTPLFTQIGPLVQDSEAPDLPAVSENGITGTWWPESISTATAGTFTFIFTPDEGQCASETSMDIVVTNRGTVADADGNIYETVKLGNQWWMAENLKTTRYNNGDLIGTTDPATRSLTGEGSPKYQWAYDGFESRVKTFGRLYTWYAVTDTRGVCPDGWHLPSDAEWATLTAFLTDNGYGYEGSGTDIGKSIAATSEWILDPTPGNIGNDQGSNNSSGFEAYPGGYRLPGGSFNNGSYASFWWSSNSGSFRALYSNSSDLRSNATSNKYGMSVRCVKD